VRVCCFDVGVYFGLYLFLDGVVVGMDDLVVVDWIVFGELGFG